ncbi:Bud site selection protein 20, partial [Ascosphaera atra]
CAKWFESEHNLVAHRRGKGHKRMLRTLKHEPHSQKMAEAVVGLSTNNGVRDPNAVVPEAIEIDESL